MQRNVYLDFDGNFMKSKSKGWTVKLTNELGHCYIEWAHYTCYAKVELQRIHKHFCHPCTNKLFFLLQRANQSTVTTEVR